MAGWTYRAWRWRYKIVAEYIRESGAKEFDAAAFLEWLKDKPDHPAFPILKN